MNHKVRKAVFPAAGLGTRFLPATKAQPKEMLPIVDKPIIQYGVEEALQSGIQNIIIVTGRGKSAIEDHFDVSFELENLLETRGKKDLLAIVRGISDMINVSYVRQKEALGLGHAVLRAKELVGEEPFAVVLADDVIEAETPCLRQLLDVYTSSTRRFWPSWKCRRRAISAYGAIDAEPVSHNGVERPRLPHSRPDGETQGLRSALQPRHYRPLRADSRDFRFAPASTPARAAKSSSPTPLSHLLRSRPIYASVRRHPLRRRRPLGFLKATVEYALRRNDLGSAVPRLPERPETLSAEPPRALSPEGGSAIARGASRVR